MLLCIYYAPSFVTLVSFYLHFTARVYTRQQTTTAVPVYSLHEFRYMQRSEREGCKIIREERGGLIGLGDWIIITTRSLVMCGRIL